MTLSKIDKWMLALLGVLLLLNGADWGLTAIALDMGGREVNPIMAPLFAFGYGWALAFKLAFVAGVGVLGWLVARGEIGWVIGLALSSVLTAGVVVWNIVQITT